MYSSIRLTELIKDTRGTIDTSTKIDHLPVNTECNIVASGVLKLAISDHYLVYAV